MQKKKELPRKRRRFLKKILFFSVFSSIIFVVLSFIAIYLVVVKLKKPLYISPVPVMQIAQANQGERMENLFDNELRKEKIDYSTIKSGYNFYLVTLSDGGKVTFSTQKDIMLQIASLQYILSHLTMEGRQFSTFDLRFDKPVVVLKP